MTVSHSSAKKNKIAAVFFFVLLAAVVAATMRFAPPWEHDVVISLKAEPVFHIGHTVITNTILASTLVVLGFIGFSFLVRRKKYDLHSRFYNAVEMLIEGLLDLVQGTVGRKVGKQIFSIIATFLLFILVNNWFGITPIVGSIGIWEREANSEQHSALSEQGSVVRDQQKEGRIGLEEAHKATGSETPVADEPLQRRLSDVEPGSHEEAAAQEVGGAHAGEEGGKIFVPLLRSANSDLNMTLAIALISVAVIQIVAVRNVGFGHYMSTFFNFKSPILFGVGLLEIISECIKILSFSFRLFGNIFAGDVLLIVIASLVPFLGPIPFIGIELFAGFIQAVVFAMLSMVFLQSHLSHGEAH